MFLLGRVIRINKKDLVNYVFIFMSSCLSSLASFLALKLIQQQYSESDFSNFVLMLRYSGFVVPTLVLGMGVAVPLYLGLLSDQGSLRAKQIVGQALIFISAMLVLFILFGLFFLDQFDQLLFDGGSFFVYAGIYFIALSFYGLASAVLRGLQNFKLASYIELVLKIPVTFIAIGLVASVSSFVVVLSASYMIVSCAVLRGRVKVDRVFDRQLFKYGYSRVLGDILYPLIFSMPILVSTSIEGPQFAVKLSIYVMVMNIFIIPVNPISVMLLPKMGELFLQDASNIGLKILRLTFVAISIGLVMSLSYVLLGQYLIDFFYPGADGTHGMIAAVLFFNVVFVLFRSVVDGLYSKSYLVSFMFVGFAVECAILFLKAEAWISVTYATTLSIAMAILVFQIVVLLYSKPANIKIET